MADAPPPQTDRNLAIDAVKGVGILQVVVHHALGQNARLYATKGDLAWTVMRTIAWSTNFAIPLFLLLSATLLAGSFVKSPGIGRFVWRRASRTLWPYVVWTLIYWAYRSRNDPGLWHDADRLGFELLSGKAYYHLYFMVILLQLSLAVPFVVLALRRFRSSFGTVLLLSGGLQALFFLLNRVPALTVASPGSLITWYVPPLLVGVWIALNRETWVESWRRGWPPMVGVATLAGAAFTLMNVLQELGFPPVSLAFNGASVLFRTSASLALLGAAVPLAATAVGPFLAALGRYSLAIYLVHPILLRLFAGPRISVAIGHLPLPELWPIVAVTALSYGFGWLISLIRLDLLLFGQTLPRGVPSASRT